MGRFFRRLTYWVRRRQLERDLAEELETHRSLRQASLEESGAAPDEALQASRRAIGNVSLAVEDVHDVWAWRWLEECGRDLRHAVRLLRRSPGFTLVAVVSLGLGIGVNSAMFTVVESVLLRPLPYAEPDRLMMVYAVGSFGPIKFRDGNFTEADYVEFQKLDTFSQLAAFSEFPASVTGGGEPIRTPRAQVTATFFTLMGVQPALGRALTAADDPTADARAVVLSDALWRSRYQADPSVLGRPTIIEGIPHVIVGVMPAGFNFPAKTQLWTPVQIRPAYRSNTTVRVIGRLATGVKPGQASAVLQTTLTNLARARSATGAAIDRERVTVVDLRESMVGRVRRLLFVLLGAVGCVLLITCTNIASLLMARAAARGPEMAIRTSIGAGRARLVRQLLTESVALSFVGGALGLLLAQLTLPALLAWMPPDLLPRVDEVHLNRLVLIFTSGLCLLTGVIFGIGPALFSSREALLRPSQQRVDSGAPSEGRLRSLLIVVEIAMVLVLLVGAGLLLKSFWKLQRVNPGFRSEQVLTMSVSLPDRVYRTADQKRAFYSRLLDRLDTLPGIEHLSAVNFMPFGELLITGDFAVEGDACKPSILIVGKPSISERYFQTLGIPLHRGRAFEERDSAGAPLVAIVSEAVARACWPDQDPVGKHLSLDNPPKGQWRTVVGVVGDIRQNDLAGRPLPTLYVPFRQEPRGFFLESMTFMMHASAGPDAAAAALREQVHALDPELPVSQVQFLDERLAASIAEPRLRTGLLVVFAALALLIAIVGIHGVMSYEVVRRTAEIGIRRALGAPTSAVLWLVIGRTTTLVALGLIAGVLGAAGATQVLKTFLYAVEPFDPLTFVIVAVALATISVVASVMPARRAAQVDPMVALRCE
jgi:predicted permease